MTEGLLSKLDDSYALRLLEEIVSIDSVVGREGELAEFLRGELDALGLEAELHEVEPGRPNVYARLEGEGPGRRLNFDGHTDTVPVVEGWETDPFTPVKREGRLYGLGSCDMKAGLACVLNMLR
ncbi:MAG: M20/M25/M40 family metallo-hydrolase, partial [Candidatus Bathyarchaeota archaeon]|nr:M20/M25/M40 family metallo-hydrolase [Candidatus Bathyarchaeota archaeon]